MSSRNSAGGCRSASGTICPNRHVGPDRKSRRLQVILHQPRDVRVILQHKNRLTQCIPLALRKPLLQSVYGPPHGGRSGEAAEPSLAHTAAVVLRTYDESSSDHF